MARFTCPNCDATLHATTDVIDGSVIVESAPDSHTAGSLGLCGELEPEAASV